MAPHSTDSTSVRDCLEPESIVVFRALKLGDMLCAVPAFRALRRRYPRARITLVGLPWAAEFAARFHAYIDDYYAFPGYPGLPEQAPRIAELPRFLARMQRKRFDLGVQLHGSGGISNAVTLLLGARETAGSFAPGSPCPGRYFIPYPDQGREVVRLLQLMEHLGIPACGESLEFPVLHSDRLRENRIAEFHHLRPRRYVVIHPGASVPERTWASERFAQVADFLASRGFAVVLTGSAGELGLAESVASRMRALAINLAGQTDLGTLAALLSNARMLVANDTGVSHIADALRVPSVIVSTGNNPARWAPADRHRHRVLCRDCGVHPEEVILAAGSHLDEPAEDIALRFGGTQRSRTPVD